MARHWHDRWMIRRRDGDTRSVSSVHDAQFFEATNHAEKEQCSPESSTRENWSDAERGRLTVRAVCCRSAESTTATSCTAESPRRDGFDSRSIVRLSISTSGRRVAQRLTVRCPLVEGRLFPIARVHRHRATVPEAV